MTTPHQIFSSNSGEPEAREKRLRPRTADSITVLTAFAAGTSKHHRASGSALTVTSALSLIGAIRKQEFGTARRRIIRQRRRLRNGNSS